MKKIYFLLLGLMCLGVSKVQSQTIITEAPAGDTKTFMRVSDVYNLQNSTPEVESQDGYATEVVFAADGSVYIKDINTDYAFGTYVKGTLTDNTVSVKLPQAIYDMDGMVVYLDKLVQMDVEGQMMYVSAGTESELLFEYKDGNLIQKEPSFVFGLALEGAGISGDSCMQFINVLDQPIQLPEGTEYETWKMRDWTGTVSDVFVAKNGNDIYLGNLAADLFESNWVKGSIQGDKVVIPSGQFYGLYSNEYGSAYMYFMAADVDTLYNELYDYSYMVYVPVDSISFDYNAEKKTLSSMQSMLVNIGPEYVNFAYNYDEPNIKYQAELTHATRPENPVITNFMEYTEYFGYGAMSFTLPLNDVEGNVLNENNVYYNVYIDGELFTFNPDEYQGITSSMTDIPYTFSDDYYDIQSYGANHTFTFFVTGFEHIGVQSIHKIGDEVAKSDIVYNDGITTAISHVAKKDAACVSNIYTDLSGRRVSVPSKGMYIHTMKMSDGSVRSVKMMK